jgi:hypothetical protein
VSPPSAGLWSPGIGREWSNPREPKAQERVGGRLKVSYVLNTFVVGALQ